MTSILQILLGLALVNYLMFDVIPGAAKSTMVDSPAGAVRISDASRPPQLKKAYIIAGTTALIFLLTLVFSALIEQLLLSRFMNSFLSIGVFVVILAGVLQVLMPIFGRRYTRLTAVPGILLPLIFANCVVIGLTMPVPADNLGLPAIFVAGLARCAGFMLVLGFFTVLRERLAGADIPAALRGAPVTLLTASLVSIMLMGFTGLA